MQAQGVRLDRRRLRIGVELRELGFGQRRQHQSPDIPRRVNSDGRRPKQGVQHANVAEVGDIDPPAARRDIDGTARRVEGAAEQRRGRVGHVHNGNPGIQQPNDGVGSRNDHPHPMSRQGTLPDQDRRSRVGDVDNLQAAIRSDVGQ